MKRIDYRLPDNSIVSIDAELTNGGAPAIQFTLIGGRVVWIYRADTGIRGGN